MSGDDVTIRKKDAHIERLKKRVESLKRDVVSMWAGRNYAWQQGYRDGRANVETQSAPEMELARQRGYRQAKRDLAWKPSASDYL